MFALCSRILYQDARSVDDIAEDRGLKLVRDQRDLKVAFIAVVCGSYPVDDVVRVERSVVALRFKRERDCSRDSDRRPVGRRSGLSVEGSDRREVKAFKAVFDLIRHLCLLL